MLYDDITDTLEIKTDGKRVKKTDTIFVFIAMCIGSSVCCLAEAVKNIQSDPKEHRKVLFFFLFVSFFLNGGWGRYRKLPREAPTSIINDAESLGQLTTPLNR